MACDVNDRLSTATLGKAFVQILNKIPHSQGILCFVCVYKIFSHRTQIQVALQGKGVML